MACIENWLQLEWTRLGEMQGGKDRSGPDTAAGTQGTAGRQGARAHRHTHTQCSSSQASQARPGLTGGLAGQTDLRLFPFHIFPLQAETRPTVGHPPAAISDPSNPQEDPAQRRRHFQLQHLPVLLLLACLALVRVRNKRRLHVGTRNILAIGPDEHADLLQSYLLSAAREHFLLAIYIFSSFTTTHLTSLQNYRHP